jgi:hypothetical protein
MTIFLIDEAPVKAAVAFERFLEGCGDEDL